MSPMIYLAGPLFTMAERVWNKKLSQAISNITNTEVFLPQDKVKGVTDENGNPDFKKIFEICLQGVNDSDILIAILDGADSDSGTCFECGYARARGKRIIGVRTDIRKTGEDRGLNAMLKYGVHDLVTYDYIKDDQQDVDKELCVLAGKIVEKIINKTT